SAAAFGLAWLAPADHRQARSGLSWILRRLRVNTLDSHLGRLPHLGSPVFLSLPESGESLSRLRPDLGQRHGYEVAPPPALALQGIDQRGHSGLRTPTDLGKQPGCRAADLGVPIG